MINNTQKISLPVLEEIYSNDLLLNQYILQSNGYFLFELEKHININPERLLSLGNPFVLFYLVKNHNLDYFFHGYVPKFISNSFFNDEYNNMLKSSLFHLHTPVFQYFNRCWHHKYSISNPPDKFLSEKDLTLFPKNGLINENSLNSLFLFHTSYPKFKSLFYPNITFDDNMSFDHAFFIEKRHLIEEYEDTSFFTTVDLLFSNFYSDNKHLSLLHQDFAHDILITQNSFTQYVTKKYPEYSHCPSEHINVRNALSAKNFDFNTFTIKAQEQQSLVEDWLDNPSKIFYSFKEKTKNKTSVSIDDFQFIKTGLNGTELNEDNLKESVLFHLLYMSPNILANYLFNNMSNIISPENSQIHCSYKIPKTIIESIINNDFFFLSNNVQLTNKSLPISKKIWDMFIDSCSSFEHSIFNYFIYNSYSQVNSTQLQFTLDLSHFEYTFFIQKYADNIKQSPLSYFHHIFKGIEFYSVFNMTNSHFTDRDLQIIKNSKLNIFSCVPLFGVELFENNYSNVISTFNEIILDNIKNIDLNDNFKNISFLSRQLGFLSPIPFFPKMKHLGTEQNVIMKHNENYDFLKKALQKSKINNSAFIHYLTHQLTLVNYSFNLLEKHIPNNYNLPYNKILTSLFNSSQLNLHQQILNIDFSHFIDEINVSNFTSKEAYVSLNDDLLKFTQNRDLTLQKSFEDFQYTYLNSLFYQSITSFLDKFIEYASNAHHSDENLIQFSLNFSDYLSKTIDINHFKIPLSHSSNFFYSEEYKNHISSIEKEMHLRKLLEPNYDKLENEEIKKRKKI